MMSIPMLKLKLWSDRAYRKRMELERLLSLHYRIYLELEALRREVQFIWRWQRPPATMTKDEVLAARRPINGNK